MLCDVLRILKQLIANGLLGIGRMGPELRHHVLIKRSGVLCSSVRFLREHRGDKHLRLLLDAPQVLRRTDVIVEVRGCSLVCPLPGDMPHAAQAVSEDTVRLLGNPGRHVRGRRVHHGVDCT